MMLDFKEVRILPESVLSVPWETLLNFGPCCRAPSSTHLVDEALIVLTRLDVLWEMLRVLLNIPTILLCLTHPWGRGGDVSQATLARRC